MSLILIAKEKEKRDQDAKQLKYITIKPFENNRFIHRAELTILTLEKEGKKNKDTEEKNRERKELVANQTKHIQELKAEREKTLQRAKSLTNELTLQRVKSQTDFENQVFFLHMSEFNLSSAQI